MNKKMKRGFIDPISVGLIGFLITASMMILNTSVLIPTSNMQSSMKKKSVSASSAFNKNTITTQEVK